MARFFFSKQKSILHEEGVCYLTSHRLIYVDAKDPRRNSVQLDLALIKSVDTYVSSIACINTIRQVVTTHLLILSFQAGFLSRSPKITIFLDGSRPALTTPSTNSMSSGNLSVKALGTWNCPICSYQNTEDLEKCQLCGVPKPANMQITTPSSMASAPLVGENACPVCTFLNHPSMVRCEMCDTEIVKFSPSTNLDPGNSSPIITTPPPDESNSVDPYIKIAFRGGGYTTCLSNLKTAIAEKAWEQVSIVFLDTWLNSG